VIRIFRHYISVTAFLLFVFETSVVAIIFYAGATCFAPASDISGGRLPHHLATAVIPALLNAGLMYSVGLYDVEHAANLRRVLPRLIACCCISGTAFIQFATFNLLMNFGGTALAAIFYASAMALAFAVILIARFAARPYTRARFPANRILVAGAGKLAAEIENLLSMQRTGSPQVVGYVALMNEAPEVSMSRIKSNAKSLLETARENGVKEIVVALDERRGAPWETLLEARLEGITITSYLTFCERETRRVSLVALDPSWLIYADGFHLSTAMNAALKRILDLGMGFGLLLLTLPTLLLVAIAIRLDSKGPILYRQERVGLHGATFRIYKFRTMQVNAEAAGVPQWAAIGDPRATRVGAFLRRMRIDELPQILNVLKGEMSFIGPRPERPFFVQSLIQHIPFYAERHRIRPGITGWAQINYPYGASIVDAEEKLSYDLYYIKNFSLFFDLLIMLSTARSVLFNTGAR
jgi:sugar transferase (PEP-CTERM system associated)